MKEVVGIFFLILIHGNDGSVYVQGPSEPVPLGMSFTLECNSTDPGVDLTQFHLRMLKNDGLWHVLGFGRSCAVDYSSPKLEISAMSPFLSGFYVCLPNNASEPDNSSQPMYLRWQELPTIVPRGVAGRILGRYRQWNSLVLRQGEDVVMDCNVQFGPKYFLWSKEGEDWMVDSPQLKLSSVEASDGGLYRCTTSDPDERSSSSSVITVSVLPEGARWYETTNGHIVIIAGGLAAALLVLIYTLAMLLFKRARRAKQAKGPIDDHSQKKPIYKGSAESIPASLSGDTQPLV